MGCLDDKLYDDIRIIKLLGAASFFSLSELMERCERFLEESKERFPIPMDSPAVLMKVALQESEKKPQEVEQTECPQNKQPDKV